MHKSVWKDGRVHALLNAFCLSKQNEQAGWLQNTCHADQGGDDLRWG